MSQVVSRALRGMDAFLDWLFPPLKQENYEARLRTLVADYNQAICKLDSLTTEASRIADVLTEIPSYARSRGIRLQIAGNEIVAMRSDYRARRALSRIDTLQYRAIVDHFLYGLKLYDAMSDDGHLTVVPWEHMHSTS